MSLSAIFVDVVGNVMSVAHNHHDCLVCLQCESWGKKFDLDPENKMVVVVFVCLNILTPNQQIFFFSM